MTNNIARSAIAAADLARIAAELASAQEDAALLARLQSAHDRVNRLTADHAKATKELDKARADEAKAAKAARFAGIADLAVNESPVTICEGVLRSSWKISWTAPTWDGRVSRPMPHSRDSFGALPPALMDYLIEKCPNRIPAKIMALAPDNPRDAFSRYFAGLKRGCLIG
jgi:hypothetical protein